MFTRVKYIVKPTVLRIFMLFYVLKKSEVTGHEQGNL